MWPRTDVAGGDGAETVPQNVAGAGAQPRKGDGGTRMAAGPRAGSGEGAVDDKVIDATPGSGTAGGQGTSATQGASADDGRISMDDFTKVELRVARVLSAEAVPKSKRLVKLAVDVGTEQRTIVAGIAEAYLPEQLVGRTVVIVFNLKPATLMGVQSNGMVLAASPEGGKPMLVSFDEPVAPGTRVR
jgi:methionyl-tRNA synthetase